MQLPASQDFAAAAAAARYALISPGALKLTAYAPASGAAEVLLPAKPFPALGYCGADKLAGLYQDAWSHCLVNTVQTFTVK